MKDDPSNLSMMELFRVEAENQTALLTTGLLELEKVASGDVNSEVASGTPAPYPSSLAALLESLMRAAHSLKGAARIVNIPSAVLVAHAMEDCFVAAQAGQLELRQPHIDLLLRGVDLLANISKHAGETELGTQAEKQNAETGKQKSMAEMETGFQPSTFPISAISQGVEDFVSGVARLRAGPNKAESRTHGDKVESRKHREKTERLPASAALRRGLEESRAEALSEGGKSNSAFQSFSVLASAKPSAQPGSTFPEHRPSPVATETPERVLRLTAENLNRLLGLAGESLVESRWLRPFSESMQRLKRMQSDLERSLASLVDGSVLRVDSEKPSTINYQLTTTLTKLREASQFLGERLQELDLFDRRSAHLSNRLYLEVLRTRMRPFGDGTRRFPRMVRDLARSLGKEARLEIRGEQTQVDRDILDRLETPLAHLLRNALDHGCETPEERVRAGKPPEATIVVEARHSAGMLLVTVADDGAGLDTAALRKKVGSFVEARSEKLDLGARSQKLEVSSEKLEAGILTPNSSLLTSKQNSSLLGSNLSENELLQFLFLPGFSLRETVTELSGRGVGLDIVQNMVRSVRGSVRVTVNKAAEKQKAESRKQKAESPFQLSAFPVSAFSSGLTFTLQLPLTLSVLRTLLVEVGGEPYAFPLAQIAQTCQLPREQVESLEGRPHFNLGDQPVGLVAGWQVFGVKAESSVKPRSTPAQADAPSGHAAIRGKQKAETGVKPRGAEGESDAVRGHAAIRGDPFQLSAFPISAFPVVVLGEASRVTGRYGLVVDRFLGERELVVQPLDRRLGKVQDISAAALMEDGAPVLIVDVDDLLRSIEKLVREGKLVDGPGLMVDGGKPDYQPSTIHHQPRRKRILAVDDSLTVRELERKLLTGRGYVAEVAHDGMEAWERLKAESRKQKAETGDPFQLSAFPISAFSPYDLVITDVDMPRLDGIELVKRIKGDEQLKSLPVMIVSFKDREEDRLRGLAAGADYYLTKGSFADDTLLQAVLDLIGGPVA